MVALRTCNRTRAANIYESEEIRFHHKVHNGKRKVYIFLLSIFVFFVVKNLCTKYKHTTYKVLFVLDFRDLHVV